MEDRNLVGDGLLVRELHFQGKRVRGIDSLPKVDNGRQRESHMVGALALAGFFQRDGKVVFEHADRHGAVRGALAFQMIERFANTEDGVGDDFSGQFQMLVAKLGNVRA